MPFLLKPVTPRSKGIIVFTHKERPYLEAGSALLGRAIKAMRREYVIGMHWGHYHDDVGPMPCVDFHLAGPGTLKFRSGVSARVIPLCSRNFTKECFGNFDRPKHWDIINVSRPIRQKNLDQFLLVIRRIFDRGYLPKVLLVCPCPPQMTEPDCHTTLLDDCRRLFSDREREHLTVLMLTADGYPFPLPSATLSFLYNSSRVFTLFSDQEGESRVIAEALLCGLPVVVKRSLRGGGRDYLDPSNSRQFDTLDQACDMFIELTTGGALPDVSSERLREELDERFTAPKLANALKDLFRELDLEFEGEPDLTDLGRKLPSHHLSLPSSLRHDLTNDLKSEEAAIRYMHLLIGRQLNWLEQRQLVASGFLAATTAGWQRLVRVASAWPSSHT